eukprot:353242-Chlamydomonas_euryale.AAC.1
MRPLGALGGSGGGGVGVKRAVGGAYRCFARGGVRCPPQGGKDNERSHETKNELQVQLRTMQAQGEAADEECPRRERERDREREREREKPYKLKPKDGSGASCLGLARSGMHNAAPHTLAVGAAREQGQRCRWQGADGTGDATAAHKRGAGGRGGGGHATETISPLHRICWARLSRKTSR